MPICKIVDKEKFENYAQLDVDSLEPNMVKDFKAKHLGACRSLCERFFVALLNVSDGNAEKASLAQTDCMVSRVSDIMEDKQEFLYKVVDPGQDSVMSRLGNAVTKFIGLSSSSNEEFIVFKKDLMKFTRIYIDGLSKHDLTSHDLDLLKVFWTNLLPLSETCRDQYLEHQRRQYEKTQNHEVLDNKRKQALNEIAVQKFKALLRSEGYFNTEHKLCLKVYGLEECPPSRFNGYSRPSYRFEYSMQKRLPPQVELRTFDILFDSAAIAKSSNNAPSASSNTGDEAQAVPGDLRIRVSGKVSVEMKYDAPGRDGEDLNTSKP